METDSFTVSKEEGGLRLDKFLSDRYPLHSRTYFQYLIENQFILVNGKAPKKRLVIQQGDEIEVYFQLTEEISLEPQNIPLDILYEDEHILVINKGAGLVVHPGPGNRSHTFVNALLYHCKNIACGLDPIRPGIVHRLDKDTTGVLIAAKTAKAHQKLISQFSQRTIEKQYLAICLNRIQSTHVDAPIGRHPTKRKEMAVVENGKKAISHFHLLAYNEEISLVLAHLKTGRTHQLRVHLKHLKAPILGDTTYGSAKANQKYQTQRQLLHAYRLKFIHPHTQLPMELVAPIAEDMKKFISSLGKTELL